MNAQPPPDRVATTTYGRPVGHYRTTADGRPVLDRGILEPKRDRIHRLGGYAAPVTILQELLPQGAVVFRTPPGILWAASARLFIEHGLTLQSDTEYLVLADSYWSRQRIESRAQQIALPDVATPAAAPKPKQRQVHLVSRNNPLPRCYMHIVCKDCGQMILQGHGNEKSLSSLIMRARREHAAEAHGWVTDKPQEPPL